MALAAAPALPEGDAPHVHRGTPADATDPVRWQRVAVGEVVDVARIGRIVVLRAATSAPRELDPANLRRMPATVPCRCSRSPGPPLQSRDGVWDALLLMRSRRVLDLEIHSDAAGLQGWLASEDGARAGFEAPSAP